MAATIRQIEANRRNARKSTGPITSTGKAKVSGNAIKHGILSNKLTLPGEDREEYQAHLEDMISSLRPSGSLETMTVEKIAINLWRQRRLVNAETAEISLRIHPERIAKIVSRELGSRFNPVTVLELSRGDAEHAEWYETIKDEIEFLRTLNLYENDWESIKKETPSLIQFLMTNVTRSNRPLDQYVDENCGGFDECLDLMDQYCDEIHARRDEVLRLAELTRLTHHILHDQDEEKYTRYQTALNNELHKLINMYRELKKMQSHFIDGDAVTLE